MLVIQQLESGRDISYSKFKITESIYTCKKIGEMKTSKKYERVNKKSTAKFLFEKLINEKHIYLMQRYLI